MTRFPSHSYLGAALLLAVAGCGDLRLADKLDTATLSAQAGAGGENAGGKDAGGKAAGGNHALGSLGGMAATTGGTVANLGGMTAAGGLAAGGAMGAIGGSAPGGSSNTNAGAMATGGTSTAGSATAGASSGAAATGGQATSTGGTNTGGASTAGSATGGAATGGASTAGSTTVGAATGGASTAGSTTGGAATGGAPTGGASTAGAAGQSGSTCPSPITKPAALLAAEPTPVNSCARVSNVVLLTTSYYAYGFTNGELYVFNPTTSSNTRVDTWSASGTPYATPKAIVTSMVVPKNNFEWALQIGHTDPQGTITYPWRAGSLGRGWNEATVERPGAVMTLTACPFHGGMLSHLELDTPWITQGSLTSGASFSAAATGKLNQHLKLSDGYRVTATEIITKSDGWLVYVGTELGEIYVSNLLVGNVTWDDATSSLSTTVVWNKITGAAMPKKWITRLAVHPTQPERIFAVFHSNSSDAVWYSADAGQSWSNRQANLPTTNNPVNLAPPVVGVSFNPVLDGAAYAVTSLTSYYTLDYGVSWAEW